jgi:hypothetical protein
MDIIPAPAKICVTPDRILAGDIVELWANQTVVVDETFDLNELRGVDAPSETTVIFGDRYGRPFMCARPNGAAAYVVTD